MSDDFPKPSIRFPIVLPDGSAHSGTVFLKPVLKHPRIAVGDYSYASAHKPPDDWATHLAPYLYEFSPERLVIGKFCQIADGVTFITSSANHRHDGFSSFPFAVFGGDRDGRPSMPAPGPDTVIGNDVWIGQGARILPGVRIGSGAIIGAGSVVAGAVPDYAIYAGNPARLVRMRFDAETVQALLDIAWWDWPIEQILRSEAAICGADIDALRVAGLG
ncbi:CatB-related O-acetyltransferase [Litoreibacter arenae]|uniref:Streptogramin acetyltransferase, putative n=1 Tax=Litoreibacter arenae DSM 19593 TaxID=1123360 RepID=S9RSF5_9RHOB|nr:CatB-related O-acetyltransferase [Litoreibacter arenae]EPX76914.1 streptogramin acetyltransferase, putative [Litoreibacter arenae DSM 19593]